MEDEKPAPRRRGPARGRGYMAGRAFGIFARGGAWRDVVEQVGLEPPRARALEAEYRTDQHLMLAPQIVEELVRLGVGGPDGIVRAQSIVDTIATLRARLRDLRMSARKGGEK